MSIYTENEDTYVLAHYWVSPKYNPFSISQERVAVELKIIPEPGKLIIISPLMMRMNTSNLGPGVYQVIDIRPNNKYTDPIYDFNIYGRWTEMGRMQRIFVKPIFTVNNRKFNNYSFIIIERITTTGEIINHLIITDNDGVLIEEYDV